MRIVEFIVIEHWRENAPSSNFSVINMFARCYIWMHLNELIIEGENWFQIVCIHTCSERIAKRYKSNSMISLFWAAMHTLYKHNHLSISCAKMFVVVDCGTAIFLALFFRIVQSAYNITYGHLLCKIATAWDSIFLCQGWRFDNFLQLLQLNLFHLSRSTQKYLRHGVISECCWKFSVSKDLFECIHVAIFNRSKKS